MKHFTNLNPAGGLRRLALAAVALAALVPSALAGTYSIVGVQWLPANSPGTATNGYIDFSNYDVQYGMSLGVEGPMPPTSTSSSESATILGQWQYVVRWVGDTGEAHPDGVSATVEFAGGANAFATAQATDGYSANGSAHLSDGKFLFPNAGSLNASAYSDSDDPDTDTESQNSPYYLATATGPFTLVTGTTNTYQGYVDVSVNVSASISAQGSYDILPPDTYFYHSEGEASASESVTARLTQVGGQRVQNDL